MSVSAGKNGPVSGVGNTPFMGPIADLTSSVHHVLHQVCHTCVGQPHISLHFPMPNQSSTPNCSKKQTYSTAEGHRTCQNRLLGNKRQRHGNKCARQQCAATTTTFFSVSDSLFARCHEKSPVWHTRVAGCQHPQTP